MRRIGAQRHPKRLVRRWSIGSFACYSPKSQSVLSYALLGRLTTYGEDFYSMGSLQTMLVDYVFAHIEHMQNRHLAPLLSMLSSGPFPIP